jgi:hypothetical protein
LQLRSPQRSYRRHIKFCKCIVKNLKRENCHICLLSVAKVIYRDSRHIVYTRNTTFTTAAA